MGLDQPRQKETELPVVQLHQPESVAIAQKAADSCRRHGHASLSARILPGVILQTTNMLLECGELALNSTVEVIPNLTPLK